MLDSDMSRYKISGYIGAKNHIFMRGAALGTWFGDFITAWMVTDMMLQVSCHGLLSGMVCLYFSSLLNFHI